MLDMDDEDNDLDPNIQVEFDAQQLEQLKLLSNGRIDDLLNVRLLQPVYLFLSKI
jgi:hypothetical protein